jgi:hypothetical protein
VSTGDPHDIEAAGLDDSVAAFDPTQRRKGKTIIRVRP